MISAAKTQVRLFLCVLPVVFAMTTAAFAQSPKAIPPAPRDYVLDEPGWLSPTEHADISNSLSTEDQQHGNQFLVAIFKSLDDEDLVDYTNRVFQKWAPGNKQTNNGLLMAFYAKEHKIRIEVGYGLEPTITDARSDQLISQVLGPSLRNQQAANGILQSIQQISRWTQGDSADTQTPVRRARRSPFTQVIPIALFFLFFFIFPPFFRYMALGQLAGSTLGYRGRPSIWDSFGGGGGGGFSGGGGSSGGGGASGGW